VGGVGTLLAGSSSSPLCSVTPAGGGAEASRIAVGKDMVCTIPGRLLSSAFCTFAAVRALRGCSVCSWEDKVSPSLPARDGLLAVFVGEFLAVVAIRKTFLDSVCLNLYDMAETLRFEYFQGSRFGSASPEIKGS